MFHAILFGENAEKRSKGETCMRIEYLEYLLEVARSKSISAAAKRLYLSQTSLSAIVNSLEKELNIKIFQRTHKGIVLTAEGEQALELAAPRRTVCERASARIQSSGWTSSGVSI